MLHIRCACKKWSDDGAPLGEGGRLAEIDRVVLQRLPPDHQQVALGRLDPLVDLVAPKAHGLRDHAFDAMLDGGVEFGLAAGLDADVGEFKNHDGGVVSKGISERARKKRPACPPS